MGGLVKTLGGLPHLAPAHLPQVPQPSEIASQLRIKCSKYEPLKDILDSNHNRGYFLLNTAG